MRRPDGMNGSALLSLESSAPSAPPSSESSACVCVDISCIEDFRVLNEALVVVNEEGLLAEEPRRLRVVVDERVAVVIGLAIRTSSRRS
jgi:hypothetical protein